MNKIYRGVKTAAVVAAIFVSAAFGGAEAKAEGPEMPAQPKPAVTRAAKKAQPKFTVKLTEVGAAEPIHRAEVIGVNLPINGDFYGVIEHNMYSGGDCYKLRFQAMPIASQHFSVGIAGQTAGVIGKSSSTDLGGVLRYQNKQPDSNIKMDLRFFPATHTIDHYAIWEQKTIFVDSLGAYNTETRKWSERLGLDYKLSKDASVGLEGRIDGGPNGSFGRYLGVRGSLKF